MNRRSSSQLWVGALLSMSLTLPMSVYAQAKSKADASRGGFTWTENPSIDKAPSGPVVANLDGQTIELKNISIESGDRKWELSARATGDFLSVGPRIALSKTPEVGKAQTSKMADGCRGSFLQLFDPERGPKATTSFNSACAYTVQITSWNVRPFEKALRGEVAGTASGKLVAVWKGGATHKDNWIAGSFTNVPVKYSHDIPLCAAVCVDHARYQPTEWTAKPTPVTVGKAAKLAWSATPTLEMAPANGVSADLNGKKFQLSKLEVVGNDKAWVLAMEKELESGTNVGVSINLWQTPTTGALYKKGLEEHTVPAKYAEYFVDAPDLENPGQSAHWSGNLAYVVQFTKWEVKPFAAAVKDSEAGKASGRVVVMMKGEDGSKNSWVAGSFTDIPVSYRRDPPLCARACVTE